MNRVKISVRGIFEGEPSSNKQVSAWSLPTTQKAGDCAESKGCCDWLWDKARKLDAQIENWIGLRLWPLRSAAEFSQQLPMSCSFVFLFVGVFIDAYLITHFI